ncbi:hypothetical protein FOZ63_018188 [Perkinsus olseni]|uniref:Uncharacterized protein n=1 Tax=Perkinsus olseni TaxID=32597 RepID=A0A7J6QWX4_PEROL|nr:hypothetical protein FOZ63_018188 [Perkinsus olseni]
MTKQMEAGEQQKESARDHAQKEAQDKLDLALTLLNERSERIVEQLKTGANFEAALKATVTEITKTQQQQQQQAEGDKENCCHHHHNRFADWPSSPPGEAVAGLKSELKLVQRQLDEVLTKAVTMRTDTVLEADRARQPDTLEGGEGRARLPAGSRVQIGGYYDEVRSEIDGIMAEVRAIKWAFDGDKSLLKVLDLEKGTLKGKKEASPLRPRMRKPPPIPYFGARVAVGTAGPVEAPQGFAAAQAAVPGYGISSKKPAHFEKLKATERFLKPKTTSAPAVKSIRSRLRQPPTRPEREAKAPASAPTKADKGVATSSISEQQQPPEWDDTVLGCEIPREPPPVKRKAPPPQREKPRPQKGKARKGVGKRQGKTKSAAPPVAKPSGLRWDAVNDLVMLIPPAIAPQPKAPLGLAATGSTLSSTAEVPRLQQRVMKSREVRSEEESLVERLMGKYGAASGVDDSVLSGLVDDIMQGSARTVGGKAETRDSARSGTSRRSGDVPVLPLPERSEARSRVRSVEQSCPQRRVLQRSPSEDRETEGPETHPAGVDAEVTKVEIGIDAPAVELRNSALQTIEVELVESGVDPLPVLQDPPGGEGEARVRQETTRDAAPTESSDRSVTRAEVNDAAVSADLNTASEGVSSSSSSSLRVSSTVVVDRTNCCSRSRRLDDFAMLKKDFKEWDDDKRHCVDALLMDTVHVSHDM